MIWSHDLKTLSEEGVYCKASLINIFVLKEGEDAVCGISQIYLNNTNFFLFLFCFEEDS